jgi:hypothetical protein
MFRTGSFGTEEKKSLCRYFRASAAALRPIKLE